MELRTIFCTLGLISSFMAQASSYTEKLIEKKENFFGMNMIMMLREIRPSMA